MSRRRHHRVRTRPPAWQIAAFGVVVAVLLVLALTGWRHQQADRRAMARHDATLPAATYPSTTIATDTVAYEQPTVPVTFRSGQPVRVLFVGDSIAAGWYATSESNAFPALVTTALSRHGQVTATNDSVPGVTASYWAARPVPSGQDLVVVELGTNDFKKSTVARFDVDYPRLIAHVHAADPAAQMLCLSVWEPEAKASAFNQTIESSCRGLYLDIATLFDDRGPTGRHTWVGTGDDFHPNNTGHRGIAQLVESALAFH